MDDLRQRFEQLLTRYENDQAGDDFAFDALYSRLERMVARKEGEAKTRHEIAMGFATGVDVALMALIGALLRQKALDGGFRDDLNRVLPRLERACVKAFQKRTEKSAALGFSLAFDILSDMVEIPDDARVQIGEAPEVIPPPTDDDSAR